MAVSLFFGLPGCGKTTLMTAHAIKAVKSKKYLNVFCNVRISVPGVTYVPNDVIGNYVLENGLILIDEATLYADSRDYRNFSKSQLTYFLTHRHFNVDINLYTQQWDAVDRKIRVITDRVYYVFKNPILGFWWTHYYRIPYGIIIPDPKSKQSGQKLGEIIQGYCKPNFLIRLFAPSIFRPSLYKYFDSWERPVGFKELPSKYQPYRQPQLRHKMLTVRPARSSMLHVKLAKFWSSLRGFFTKSEAVSRRYAAHEAHSDDSAVSPDPVDPTHHER